MDFNFYSLDNTTKSQEAMIHISIDQDYPVLRVDVDLGSIPGADGNGYEVIVNF
jgi:hypothetical protein